jgi:putative DNA primase/helicase
MRYTDLGNARELLKHCGHDYKHFTAKGTWYKWDGGLWAQDPKASIMLRAAEVTEELLRKASILRRIAAEADEASDSADGKRLYEWALASQFRERLNAMIALAATLEPVGPEDFDSNPYLLNCRNGVVDLRDGSMQPPERSLLITKQAQASYVPGAHSELWCRFIEQCTNGDSELAAYLQRCAGYALLGEWREKLFWFAYGPPDGGKSTFLNVLAGIMGSYAKAPDSATWMRQQVGGNRGDIVELMGCRLAISSEIKAGEAFDSKLLKQVTGGDKLTFANKYEKHVTFPATWALWLCGNDRPWISADDDGVWRRLQCVPFTHAVPKHLQDKQLAAKLLSGEHASAVLAWMIEGHAQWAQHGIGSCAAVDAANKEYRDAMNPLAGFAEECLVLSPTLKTAAQELLALYRSWCQAHQVRKPVSPQQFNRALTELGCDQRKSNLGRYWHGAGVSSEGKEYSF